MISVDGGIMSMIGVTQETEAWRPYLAGASVGPKSDGHRFDGQVSSQLGSGLLLLAGVVGLRTHGSTRIRGSFPSNGRNFSGSG